MKVFKLSNITLSAMISLMLLGCDANNEREMKKNVDKINYQEDKDEIYSKKILSGGYILHFRHGNRKRYITTPQTPETDVTGFDGISLAMKIDEQRHSFGALTCLTEDGVAEAKLIKQVFDHVGVKVQKVLTSPSCRARQTAMYAFGYEGEIVNSLLHTTAMPKKMRNESSLNLKNKLLSIEIEPGKNIILSGHNGTLNDVVIDLNESGDYNARDDAGFTVIEKLDGKLIARHTFKRFRDFSTEVVNIPLN
jgi:phosphohistidine phosphatase SixA